MKRIGALLLCFLTVFFFVIRVNATTENVFYKNRDAKGKVALTFDDGPHPRLTPAILDILEEYGIVATFFVVGRNVENYPEAFERLLASECEIGNHTYSHKNLGNLCEEDIIMEISGTENAVSNLSERKLSVLRPPQGMFGDNLARVCMSKGYNVILWSIDTRDWAHNPSEKIVENVLRELDDGDIILMHDYVAGASPTCEALRILIPEILSRGYEFVCVSDLIS
ncbi:MAG: hypothetical protein E7641_05135 [Ruminococcaceae bacterium]|nr:hypothetical protein [Oscillospiraceae bacterium]